MRIASLGRTSSSRLTTSRRSARRLRPGWILTLLCSAGRAWRSGRSPGSSLRTARLTSTTPGSWPTRLNRRSPYQAFYEVRWQPLPNWAGHLALAGLLFVVSPWTADRIMMTVTLLGFASRAALAPLAGPRRPLSGPCLLAALLGMNCRG